MFNLVNNAFCKVYKECMLCHTNDSMRVDKKIMRGLYLAFTFTRITNSFT